MTNTVGPAAALTGDGAPLAKTRAATNSNARPKPKRIGENFEITLYLPIQMAVVVSI